MGFLKNLFSVIENVSDALGVDSKDVVRDFASDGMSGGKTSCRNTIEEVVTTDCAGYELRKNVPSSEMYAPSGSVDYTYGIYKDGYPVLFINVIDNRNDYSLKRYRMAKKAAEDSGIMHMNFFTHLPNERNYVSNRIRAAIFK